MSMVEGPRPLDAEQQSMVAGPDPGSPLGRLIAARERRQQTASLDIDVPGMPGFVARVGVISDADAAMGAMRLFLAFMAGEQTGVSNDEVLDEAINVIAAGVMSLHVKTPDGLQPVTDEHGLPVRLDVNYGRAVGRLDINTARAAVVDVFTSGQPPVMNATALLTFATAIAGFNNEQGQAIAPGL